MKIAFIVERFPSLSETFILNQITGLIDRGHEVYIYANCSQNESKVHPDIEKYSLKNRTYYSQIPANKFLRLFKGIGLLIANFHINLSVLLRALNAFKYGKPAASLTLLYMAISMLHQRQDYDIIHCHFGPNGFLGTFLRDIGVIQGKVITTYYGNDISEYIRKYGTRVYEKLFATGNLFFPISDYMRRQLIELGCDENKLIIHPLGIDCSKFSFTPRQQPQDGIVRLLTIARLVEKKGLEYSINAVAKLLKAGINIEYSIVGDGALREELEKLIQNLDVSNRVKLLGWRQQQEVIDIINNSHILIVPSVTSKEGDQEGTPTVLMEGMAMGLPVVSTLHSGIPEVVEDGVSGFLVPERDVDALAEKLGYLVEHPEVWSSMGLAGRSFVEAHYNIDKLSDRLVKIYQDLLREKTGDKVEAMSLTPDKY